MSSRRPNPPSCISGEQIHLASRITHSNPASISPACILSFLITTLVRGEFKSAWSWSDDPEKPLESADTALVDTKSDGNGSITGGADVPQVEEKGETERS